MYKGSTLIYSLEVLKCKLNKFKNCPQIQMKVAPKPSHEEGVISSLTLAPPYLLLHLSTNALPLILLTKDLKML